jgi:hypothetical protein
MDSEKDTLNKIRIANAKIQLVELSSNIKTYKESMCNFKSNVYSFNNYKKLFNFPAPAAL